ncbi:MAG: hypothetical protein IJF53_05110 [Clostridia bacterium]|nr:hypothetical protein [Clostridia bacterium]
MENRIKRILIFLVTPFILVAGWKCFRESVLSIGGDDPDWYLTHHTVYSPDEAISAFGNDLLLDRIIDTSGEPYDDVENYILEDYGQEVLDWLDPPVYREPYTEYQLEFSDDGSLGDKSSWKSLFVNISYSGARSDKINGIVFPSTTVIIYFDLSFEVRFENYNVQKLAEDGYDTTSVGDILVYYKEYADSYNNQRLNTVFDYNGMIYRVNCGYMPGTDFGWETLNRMLAIWEK